jgi:hypothetical protein
MKRLSVLFVSLVAASVAMATTWVRVEKDGSKTYSDRPLPGGQPMEVQPAQTYSAPKNPDNTSSTLGQTAEQRALAGIDDFQYSSCSLSPANDETFTNPESIEVRVSVEPSIRPGDSVNLVVDGRAADPYEMSVILQMPDRGQHTGSVTLKDTYGRVLCRASVSFNVIRPSVNLPGRR